jgi:hypothetical protein
MTAEGTERQTLNFVVTGEARTGVGTLATSINNRGGAVCHLDLFARDDAARRAAHEAYFGPSEDSWPTWFVADETHPWHYLNDEVFDNPRKNETAVGCHLPYDVVRRYELYELLALRCRDGDFCLVHVVRNPVAALVSARQAEKSGVASRGWQDKAPNPKPAPIRLDADELVEFCRTYEATRGKVRAACDDALEVRYADLLLNYQDTMQKVFDFLELPPRPELARPSCRRLRNGEIRERVTNLVEIRSTVPSDVRALIDADDLF